MVAGTILFTTLLCFERLGQASYVVLMSALAVLAIVLYGFNRIREVDLKNLKVTLDKIEQVRDEVYAKAETLRGLAENLADIATILATDRLPQLIEFGSPIAAPRYKREAVRFATKQKVVSILSSTGADQARIMATGNLFDARIRTTLNHVLFAGLHSHARRVIDDRLQNFQRELAALHERGIKQTDPEYQDCVNRSQQCDKESQHLRECVSESALEQVFRQSAVGLGALDRHLQSTGIWSADIERHLKDFKEFITKHPVDMTVSEQPPAD